MKKVILCGFIMAAMASCKKEGDKTETEKTVTTETTTATQGTNPQERNLAAAKGYVEALGSGDVQKITSYISDNYTEKGDLTEPEHKFTSRDSVMKMYNFYKATFPDMKESDVEYFVDGNDKIAVVGTFTGTWKGDMEGQKANGKSFSFRDCDILTFDKDGKITEHSFIYPSKAMMEQIGFKMPVRL